MVETAGAAFAVGRDADPDLLTRYRDYTRLYTTNGLGNLGHNSGSNSALNSASNSASNRNHEGFVELDAYGLHSAGADRYLKARALRAIHDHDHGPDHPSGADEGGLSSVPGRGLGVRSHVDFIDRGLTMVKKYGPFDFGLSFDPRSMNERHNVWSGTCHVGQLTQRGYGQQYALGKALRERYSQSLDLTSGISHKNIFARSTDIPRTILSGESLLSGFLEPINTGDPLSSDLHANMAQMTALMSRIPMHTVDQPSDNMFPNHQGCPKTTKHLNSAKETEAWKSLSKEFASRLMKALSEKYPHVAEHIIAEHEKADHEEKRLDIDKFEDVVQEAAHEFLSNTKAGAAFLKEQRAEGASDHEARSNLTNPVSRNLFDCLGSHICMNHLGHMSSLILHGASSVTEHSSPIPEGLLFLFPYLQDYEALTEKLYLSYPNVREAIQLNIGGFLHDLASHLLAQASSQVNIAGVSSLPTSAPLSLNDLYALPLFYSASSDKPTPPLSPSPRLSRRPQPYSARSWRDSATLISALAPYSRDISSIKFSLFSGHDTTLIPMLHAFGLFDGEWPPYASHIEMELYRRRDGDTVGVVDPMSDDDPLEYASDTTAFNGVHIPGRYQDDDMDPVEGEEASNRQRSPHPPLSPRSLRVLSLLKRIWGGSSLGSSQRDHFNDWLDALRTPYVAPSSTDQRAWTPYLDRLSSALNRYYVRFGYNGNPLTLPFCRPPIQLGRDVPTNNPTLPPLHLTDPTMCPLIVVLDAFSQLFPDRIPGRRFDKRCGFPTYSPWYKP